SRRVDNIRLKQYTDSAVKRDDLPMAAPAAARGRRELTKREGPTDERWANRSVHRDGPARPPEPDVRRERAGAGGAGAAGAVARLAPAGRRLRGPRRGDGLPGSAGGAEGLD